MSNTIPRSRPDRPDAEVEQDSPPSALSRRDFVALGTGALLLFSLPRAIGGRRHGLVRRTVPAMGTFAEIVVSADDRRFAHAAVDTAIQELRRVEGQLTRFRPDSDVGRANRAPAGVAVPVSSTTADALEAARRWAESSGGRFDPCLQRAMLLWDVGSRQTPPALGAARRFAQRELYRYLEVERSGDSHALRLHHPAAGIDLGGIGKGFGVDRAVQALRQHGVRDALVNLGGDLYAMGRSEDGDPWTIGVRSPDEPARLATMLRVTDQAVATSGDYIQYFEHEGRRYHHLLDPRTGEPRCSAWRSVTVVAPDCTTADAAATALFGTEPKTASRRLKAWAPDARVQHVA